MVDVIVWTNITIFIYVLINITVYSKKKKCLSHIGCVCLVSAVYNLSLQLQRLDSFVVVLVVVLWLNNLL